MLEAIIWGLVQGLTEFLPVSSSGHLRVIPDLLGIAAPDLSTSAVLHLGTLGAVVAYFRHDLVDLIRGLPSQPASRRSLGMVIVATIPAGLVGILLSGAVESFQESTTAVGAALILTGIVLLLPKLRTGPSKTVEELSWSDSVVIGLAQALALLPGISRSGMVIVGGVLRGLVPEEAGRFGFIIAIPIILGAGLGELLTLETSVGLSAEVVVGTLVAGVAGYGAIHLLLNRLLRRSLTPFALYCVGIGLITLFMF